MEKMENCDMEMLELNDLLNVRIEMVSRCLNSPRGGEMIIGLGDIDFKSHQQNSLAVQWLRSHASSAGVAGSMPGWELRSTFVTWLKRGKK